MSRRARTYVDLNLNPVRKFRKRLSLTINEAALEADVHLQTWYLTERGACRDIPSGIVKFIEKKNGWNSAKSVSLQTEFRSFQSEARSKFWEVQGDRILAYFDAKTNGEYSEPISFLEGVMAAANETPMGLSKHICVAPTVLAATLNGRRQKLPKEILHALIDAGWPVEKIFNTGVRI